MTFILFFLCSTVRFTDENKYRPVICLQLVILIYSFYAVLFDMLYKLNSLPTLEEQVG